MPGIQNSYLKAVAQVITSSAALITTGLKEAIAANQTKKFRWWVPISVGATGGVRLQVVVPAGGTAFTATIRLNNTVAPGATIAAQVASAAFTNALANAGNHWIEVEAVISNGATAGDVDLQIAQNTSDALSLTVFKGATLETFL